MSYDAFLSPRLVRELLKQASPVAGIAGLAQVGEGGGLETSEGLRFLVELYGRIRGDLELVLSRRGRDRKFIDERVKACAEFNRSLGRDVTDPAYQTVLGLEDADGRIVFGPLGEHFSERGGKSVAPLPSFLQGPHVTLFGPPDTARLSINAMNAYHRKLPGEPAIVGELLAAQSASPFWGADDEDSKTPLRADLIEAGVNLTACLEGTLSTVEGGKTYALAQERLALPIKRFPGLAMPSAFLFLRDQPIPLHLYDFALHVFRNWDNPKALVFYVPKLENEEEAAYIRTMVATAEEMIRAVHPSYVLGSIRLMIVLENPRAILRAHEIMDALHPYFAGASLGWHDYLASTARLLREDPGYRIPVKADPDIVIKYILASHRLLAEVVGSRGGIQVGGMYGILPQVGNAESLQVTLRGFFKDVITQLRRGLTGFWVAHPDFVRLGLAIVEAWKQGPARLEALVLALLEEPHAGQVLKLARSADILPLDSADPGYVRKLIVADLPGSDFVANNDPEEIRYNVFQSLQYLADWLSGNGCVALPTVIDGVPVRVMDDLATAERSRWEVWAELKHGRFSIEDFVRIAHEEMNFIRRDLSDESKIVQVKWDERTARWYPVAYRLMLQLMTAREPAEFATELLLPFTIDSVRGARDPWKAAVALDPDKFRLERHVADLDHYFEICGSVRFAREMAANAVEDLRQAEEIVTGYSLEEIQVAASFHGDIGQSAASLDARASSEQARVLTADDAIKLELRRMGEAYRSRFGFKFLVSAKGKTAAELLESLQQRSANTVDQELRNARLALWEISRKRVLESPRALKGKLEEIRARHGVRAVGIAVNYRGRTQELTLGGARRETRFQLASLSKTLASAFAIEFFRERGIGLDHSVNSLLAGTSSAFRLESDQVTLAHLMSHSALDMHYVKGIPAQRKMPSALELLQGNAELGYEPVKVICEPGAEFHYSGGGFIVLEHLIDAMGGKPAAFLKGLGLEDIGLEPRPPSSVDHARGYMDSGDEVPGGRLSFPSFAAGGSGSAGAMAEFLLRLSEAFQSLRGSRGISHDTAVQMLHGSDKGCRAFMGCDMGLGVFTIEAGSNRFALHQGANEGFRALYLHCYSGPDEGKGLVLLANGDNRAVPMIAEMARELLEALEIDGIDWSRLGTFEAKGVAQEQIVNLGYKTLLLDAFLPDLPEPIVRRGPPDPLAAKNLAVGARIVSVSNQKFARAENLISPFLPIFEPELYGRQGKVMDSWESARHNPAKSDFLELELLKPSPIRYVSLSTKFHDGNHPEAVRLLGRSEGEWVELLPRTPLQGHSLLVLESVDIARSFSSVRVEMFPDGGLTRLGLFMDKPSLPIGRFPDSIPKSRKPLTIPYQPDGAEIERNFGQAGTIDCAGLAFGGTVIRASNEHYGPAAQVISPYPPIHMFDGLESARSRVPGHFEEVELKLGKPVRVERVVLDFTFFVNNNPLFVSIQGWRDGAWVELVPRSSVKAFAGNQKEFLIRETGLIERLLIRAYPDGGIHRIRAL